MIFSISLFFLYPQLSFSETVNTKNQSSIESIPFTFIGIESNKTVNPVLLEQSKDFNPAKVIEVTPGVYTDYRGRSIQYYYGRRNRWRDNYR